MEEQSLSNYTVVQTFPNYLVLKDEASEKEFIYKEYEIPNVCPRLLEYQRTAIYFYA